MTSQKSKNKQEVDIIFGFLVFDFESLMIIGNFSFLILLFVRIFRHSNGRTKMTENGKNGNLATDNGKNGNLATDNGKNWNSNEEKIGGNNGPIKIGHVSTRKGIG